MSDEKKLDEILENTRKMKNYLETMVTFVNSFIFGVITVIVIRRITQK